MIQTLNNQPNECALMDAPVIDRLMVDLSSRNRRTRLHAREQLTDLGRSAVPALIHIFNSSGGQVRWEAAKTLVEIGDPSVAPVLVQALDDEYGEIRWLAAEGLIAIGRPAVVPLLRALIEHSDSVWLRRRAHQVLQTMLHGELADVLSPVLAAMEDIEPVLQVPVAAYMAITRLS